MIDVAPLGRVNGNAPGQPAQVPLERTLDHFRLVMEASLMSFTRCDVIKGSLATGLALPGLWRVSDADASQEQPPLTQVMLDLPGWIEDMEAIWDAAPGDSTVEMRIVPFADLDRTIRAIPDDPAPPALLCLDGPNIPTYATLGILRSLDDVFAESDRADFLPGPIASSVWNGSFYGPALTESSQGLYFNQEVLDRHGITPPASLEEAWTWLQVRDIALEVQAKERERLGSDQFWGISISAVGDIRTEAMYEFGSIVRSNGDDGSPARALISEDGYTTEGYVNAPEAVEVYEFLQALHQEDGAAPLSESSDFFINSQCALWVASMYHHTIIAADAPDLSWGVTPFPYFRNPIVHTGSYHVGVCALSDQADQAAELVRFLGQPDQLARTNRTVGQIPPRTSILDTMPEINVEPLKIFTDTALQWGAARPQTAGYSEYLSVFSTMIADILEGAPAREAADLAAIEIDRQLARYRNLAG